MTSAVGSRRWKTPIGTARAAGSLDGSDDTVGLARNDDFNHSSNAADGDR
jgi:hypothetical protein